MGYAGAITLIGDEAPGPVDRPNLSKDFLAGNAPMEWVTLRDDAFYEKLGIEFIKGDEVIELDPKGKSITLESGRKVPYDKLLLATGSEPVRLPIEGASLPHVKTLRTLADAQAIIAAAANARRAVIIGSSFIGLEVAASLRARNLEVDVVSRDSVPLGNILGRAGGRVRAEAARREGRSFSPRRPTARDSCRRGRARGRDGSRPISSCSASA